MRHDDLVFARALQDLVHGRVDALSERRCGLGTRHALVVSHPVPGGRRRDEPLIQPFLRPALRLAVGLLRSLRSRIGFTPKRSATSSAVRRARCRSEEITSTSAPPGIWTRNAWARSRLPRGYQRA